MTERADDIRHWKMKAVTRRMAQKKRKILVSHDVRYVIFLLQVRFGCDSDAGNAIPVLRSIP